MNIIIKRIINEISRLAQYEYHKKDTGIYSTIIIGIFKV